MSKLLLTGDWQAEFRNLRQCDKAHEQEMELVRKHKPFAVIDLGDLKEQYNNGDYRALEFQMKRAQNIRAAGSLFIALMGNHDRYGQYADTSNWFSILKDSVSHAVVAPDVLKFAGKEFELFCLPFRSNIDELREHADVLSKLSRRSQAKRKLLLFHCNLKNALFTNGMESTSGFTVGDLHYKNYDWCFGGDIHRRQKVADNVMYIGNPFCHDWGEANLKKGFTLYDTQTNKQTFVPSVVPGWYTWEWLEKHKDAEVLKGSRIRRSVVCSLEKDYYGQIAKAQKEVKTKYPQALVTVRPEFESAKDATADAIVKGGQSDAAKIEAYVDATLPDSLRSDRDGIVRYMEKTLEKVGATRGSAQQVRFLDVEARNILSFKSLKFSYEKRGVCLVEGVNRDWHKHSIGAGKSNFLSMIPVACFGTTFKKQKSDDLAYEHNKKQAEVKLRLKVDNERITIVRGRRPVRLQMFVDGKDMSSGRRHTGRQDTQGLLEGKIGFTFDTLASTVYIDSKFSNAFLSGTDKQRAELISTFQNLGRFEMAKKLVVAEISRVSNSRSELEGKKEVEKALLAEVREAIEKVESIEKKSLQEAKQRMVMLGKKYSRSKKLLAEFVKTHEKKLARLAKTEEELENKLEESRRAVYRCQREIADAQSHLNSLASSEGGVCPECGQDLPKDEVESTRKQVLKNLKASKKELSDAKPKLAQLESELGVVREQQTRLTVERRELRRVTSERFVRLREARVAYVRIKESRETTDYRKKEDELKRSLARCQSALEAYEKEYHELTYMRDGFGRNGLPQFINKMLCPVLNAAAKEYSELFTDGEITVCFTVRDGMYVPKIVNAHGSKKLSGQSTGESAWASIITSFALLELGPKSNLLILDEPGNGLDPASAVLFAQNLKKLNERFETILVTTHNAHIVAELDGVNTITVSKKNKVSSLVL